MENDQAYSSQSQNYSKKQHHTKDLNIYSLRTLKTYLALTTGGTLQKYRVNWTKSGMMSNGQLSILENSFLNTVRDYSLLDILEERVPSKYFLSSNLIKNVDGKIIVKQATKKGYAVANIGDSINISQPNSKTRRGRVGKGIANTLLTSPEQAVLTNEGIRMLTPLEEWKLQGFTEEDYNKAKGSGVSERQLYKQAGNSVTVDVIFEIGKRLQ